MKIKDYSLLVSIPIFIISLSAKAETLSPSSATEPASNSAVATASEFSNLKVAGTARLRFEDTQWYGATGAPTTFTRAQFFSLRIRPKIEWKIEEGLSVVVTPQFAKVLGRDYSYTQTDSSGVVGYNENFHMHEAYLKWALSSNWSLQAGRMTLAYGDQYIIAFSDWPLTGKAFDGAKLSYMDDTVEVDLLGLKLDAAKDLVGSDKELVGIHTKWKLFDALKAHDMYAYYESNQQGGANDSRHLYGIRLAAEIDKAFDISAEWATQAGTSGYLSDTAYQSMLTAGLGWTFQDFYKFRVGFGYDQADRNWRDWYPLYKSPLGRNEVLGRRNLKAMALRLSASPTEKLKVRLDYWVYNRLDNQSPIYRPNTAVAVGAAGGSTSDAVGDAIDLSFSYKASERVEYGLGATAFQSGDYLKQQFEDRVLTDFYAVANLTF